jgi:predicted short-subunit dehydrogenase-like oxidoreductase (DUF2520 family)
VAADERGGADEVRVLGGDDGTHVRVGQHPARDLDRPWRVVGRVDRRRVGDERQRSAQHVDPHVVARLPGGGEVDLHPLEHGGHAAPVPSLRVVGFGRAGSAVHRSLAAAGWQVRPALHRDDDPAGAARDVDLLVLAVPDAAIAGVAARVEPSASAVVAHLSGALPLDVLAPHVRRGSLHPLVSIPDAGVDLRGRWFGVAGDDLVRRAVADLGGRPVEVADADRAAYHAAAAVASNHLVALLGQVERIAAAARVPLDAYLDLVRGTVDNVARLGPAGALTGPVARGDWVTVDRHLGAIPDAERPAYRAMADLAARLVDR